MSALAPTLGVSRLTHRADFVPIERGSHVATLPKRNGRTGKYAGEGAGLPMLVVYARFVAWAIEQTHFPMPEQVQTRFRCSRATSHRWLNCLAEAYGVDRPVRDCSGEIKARAAA